MLANSRSWDRWRERIYRTCQLTAAGICAFIVALLLSAPFPAQAARADGGSAQFSIRPVAPDSTAASTTPYFVLNLTTGASIQSKVRITNTGTARGSVALYPVDATTGQTSGVVYRSHNDPRADVSAWVTLGTQHLSLDPGQSQIVAFTVMVPTSARPGQHVGGLVAENLAVQSGSGSGVQINIQHLSIVAVQVNLPGQQSQRLEATGIRAGGEHSYQILYLSLRNTGTQMFKPSGTLQVTDAAGHQLKQMTLALDTVLPQTAIDYPVYVAGQALGPGHYRGVLSLNYGDPRQTLRRTFTFEITTKDLQQVFGSTPPNTPPNLAGGGSGNVPAILALVGGVVLILGGVGASILFVPTLRARIRFHGLPFRKR